MGTVEIEFSRLPSVSFLLTAKKIRALCCLSNMRMTLVFLKKMLVFPLKTFSGLGSFSGREMGPVSGVGSIMIIATPEGVDLLQAALGAA